MKNCLELNISKTKELCCGARETPIIPVPAPQYPGGGAGQGQRWTPACLSHSIQTLCIKKQIGTAVCGCFCMHVFYCVLTFFVTCMCLLSPVKEESLPPLGADNKDRSIDLSIHLTGLKVPEDHHDNAVIWKLALKFTLQSK